ncbi:hypothetical protein M5D96_004941 [Drosophila gunungcola]|uniref:Uncharacterized protein n=1 Tax=Drosophila gunungcola TaxID=103775 RepID=A0A9P9YV03_9MUSC|nr:hypothetical protein M5D96_004941 [Drosophila gunungcola]
MYNKQKIPSSFAFAFFQKVSTALPINVNMVETTACKTKIHF